MKRPGGELLVLAPNEEHAVTLRHIDLVVLIAARAAQLEGIHAASVGSTTLELHEDGNHVLIFKGTGF